MAQPLRGSWTQGWQPPHIKCVCCPCLALSRWHNGTSNVEINPRSKDIHEHSWGHCFNVFLGPRYVARFRVHHTVEEEQISCRGEVWNQALNTMMLIIYRSPFFRRFPWGFATHYFSFVKIDLFGYFYGQKLNLPLRLMSQIPALIYIYILYIYSIYIYYIYI